MRRFGWDIGPEDEPSDAEPDEALEDYEHWAREHRAPWRWLIAALCLWAIAFGVVTLAYMWPQLIRLQPCPCF
jgi:hypothetical protein